MSEMNNIGASERPIFVERSTGFLLTTNPATGDYALILDANTRKPLTQRMIYVDALTKRYNYIDMKTGKVVDLIDPVTDKPMLAEPLEIKIAEEHDDGEAANVKLDEQALTQADADDGGDFFDDGPTRRENEPSLMELIEQMDEEVPAEEAPKAVAVEPAVETPASASIEPPKQSDYLKTLPHVNTRDVTRTDGIDIATLIVVALAIVVIIIGQMLYWVLLQ